MIIKMNYEYVKKMGGTDSSIHLTCPKCGSQNVVIIVLDEGHYGVEECKDCKFKNKDVEEHLSGKLH